LASTGARTLADDDIRLNELKQSGLDKCADIKTVLDIFACHGLQAFRPQQIPEFSSLNSVNIIIMCDEY
jgi:hypothetical protein